MSSNTGLSNPEEVSITVLEARNLPDIRSINILKNARFYVTVLCENEKSKKTESIRAKNNTVLWDRKFENINIRSFSPGLTLYCFATKHLGADVLIGKLDLPIVTFHTFADKGPHDYTLISSVAELDKQTTLRLTLFAKYHSLGTTAHAISARSRPGGNVTHGQSVENRISSDNIRSAPLEAYEAINDADQRLGRMHKPGKNIATAANAIQNLPGVSKEVTEEYGTWETILGRVDLIVGIVDGIAKIHPYAEMAWNVLSLIPKVHLM